MSIEKEEPRRSSRLQRGRTQKISEEVNNSTQLETPTSTDSKRNSTSVDSKPTKRSRSSKITTSTLTSSLTDKDKTITPVVNGSTVASECRYWLMKAEPNSRLVNGVDVKFSIEDLQACPNQTSSWEGVRNYEARNILRDQMKLGDQVLFYHSNCSTPGICGLATIVKEGYVDHTAFDPKHPYYDPKSDIKKPRWYMVDVKYVRTLKRFISLKELQSYKSTKLSQMTLINRGRLSVQPVRKDEFDFILTLENTPS